MMTQNWRARRADSISPSILGKEEQAGNGLGVGASGSKDPGAAWQRGRRSETELGTCSNFGSFSLRDNEGCDQSCFS